MTWLLAQSLCFPWFMDLPKMWGILALLPLSWGGRLGHVSSTQILEKSYSLFFSNFSRNCYSSCLHLFPPIHTDPSWSLSFAFVTTLDFSDQDGQWAKARLVSSKGVSESWPDLTMSGIKHSLLNRWMYFPALPSVFWWLFSFLGSISFTCSWHPLWDLFPSRSTNSNQKTVFFHFQNDCQPSLIWPKLSLEF